MKLAFISTILGYPWGGADSLWTSAAEAAANRGDGIMLGLSAKTSANARIERLQAGGARLVHRATHATRLSGRERLKQGLRRVGGNRPFLDSVAAFQPDAVVLCQGGTYDFLVEPLLVDWLRETGIPAIVVCQANADSLGPPPAARSAAAEFLSQVRATVFVSEHNRRLAERQLDLRLANSHVVQNPMPGSFPALSWPGGSPIRFAAVGRLENATKGFDLLLPALAKELRDVEGWSLDFFGRGADRERLEQQAQNLRLGDRIQFRGFADDVSSVWRDHHALVLPSRVEGCSLAMMEAVASGRPVIATPVGGVDEWIEDDVNGFVCASIDEAAIGAAISRAWNARESWPAMGALGAAKAERLIEPAPGSKLLALLPAG